MTQSSKCEGAKSSKWFKWCCDHKIPILALSLTVLILFSIAMYPLLTRNAIELQINVAKSFEDGSFKRTACGHGYGWVTYEEHKCIKVMDIFAMEKDAQLICNIETQKDKEYEESQDFQYPRKIENNPCELLTVKSSKELKFLTHLLFVKDKTMVGDEKVWLGAKRQRGGAEEEKGVGNEEKSPINFVWNNDETNTMLHVDLGLDVSGLKSSPVLRNQLEPSHWKKGYPKDVKGRECVAMVSKRKKGAKTNENIGNNNNNNDKDADVDDGSVKGLLENVSCSGRHLVVCQKRQVLSLSTKKS